MRRVQEDDPGAAGEYGMDLRGHAGQAVSVHLGWQHEDGSDHLQLPSRPVLVQVAWGPGRRRVGGVLVRPSGAAAARRPVKNSSSAWPEGRALPGRRRRGIKGQPF